MTNTPDVPVLRSSSTSEPGWTRRRSGRGFTYLDEHGQRLSDRRIQQVKELVIPPAWTDVWICPDRDGHLQAVGTDEAGRRQYLYHPQWREAQDALKFERAAGLGRALGRARNRVAQDLAGDAMPLERACAAAFRMLDLGCFRIGNDVYADEDHGGFGLASLERSHVRGQRGAVLFDFCGKSGVDHHIEVDDPDVVTALTTMRRRRSGDDRLLQHRDERGWHHVTPQHVNDYVREVTGIDATAKDFRTWHATVICAAGLAHESSNGLTDDAAVLAALDRAAELLGNSRTQARDSYVDPRILQAYRSGHHVSAAAARRWGSDLRRRRPLELEVLALVESVDV